MVLLLAYQEGLALCTLDLNNTLAVKVNDTALVIRNVTDDLSQQLSPFTGKKSLDCWGIVQILR